MIEGDIRDHLDEIGKGVRDLHCAVCVCERERERVSERETLTHCSLTHTLSHCSLVLGTAADLIVLHNVRPCVILPVR